MEDTKAKIREFLARFFRNHQLKDDEDIFSLGYVNSMFAMQLVLFVEKEFQVTVDNDDLSIENFNSVNAIANFVESKTAAKTM